MRIGVNCFLLDFAVGGVRTYFFSLFNELLRADQENEYVFFYFGSGEKHLRRLKSERWRKGAVKLQDQREIRDHIRDIDLFFCPFGSLYPRPIPVAAAITLVDIQHAYYPDFFSSMELFNREYHYSGSVQMADQVITISEFSKRTMVETFGVTPDKIKVSWLCLDPDRERMNMDLPPEGSKPPFDKFILYPANRWHHKNHDGLLRALVWLKLQKNLVVNAVVTGQDIDKGCRLDEKVRSLGIEEQVYDAGYVSDAGLAFLYAKAEAMVFPSLFEGFGLPLLEAMSHGCPIACSNTSSLPEIGKEAAVYFNPRSVVEMAKAIEKLWLDESLRKRLTAAGFRRLKNFSAQRMARAHVEAFHAARNRYSSVKFPFLWLFHKFHGARYLYRYRNLFSGKEMIRNIVSAF